MKNMIKQSNLLVFSVAVMLSAAMCITITACGGNDDAGEASSPTGSQSANSGSGGSGGSTGGSGGSTDGSDGGGGDASVSKQTFKVRNVEFSMVAVDGGTFLMGAQKEFPSQPNYDASAMPNEAPVHSVTLSSFSIGESEVTQELWQAVMGSNPSYSRGDNLPVERVSWDDCQTFISKLNDLTGKTFRLPTEAEWEFAARGGNKSHGYIYAGGNSIDELAWYHDNSSEVTKPVKSKTANELGLYDMTGNVWEWCNDLFSDYKEDAQTNPTGPVYGSHRVFRGGSRGNPSYQCRITLRMSNVPSGSLGDLGLRLAL